MTFAPRRCSIIRGRSRMPSTPAIPRIGAIEPALDRAKAEDRAAGARPAWRQGGERRVAGDVRNARHCLHRVRFGVVASRLRQGGGQTLCRHRRREGAGRRRAGRYRCGVCRIRQADCKAGARRIELRADLRQRAAGSRRRPQRGEDRGLSDRAVHLGRGSDLRRAGAVGRLADLRCRRSRSSRRKAVSDSTTAPNIWRRPRRKSALAVLLPRS